MDFDDSELEDAAHLLSEEEASERLLNLDARLVDLDFTNKRVFLSGLVCLPNCLDSDCKPFHEFFLMLESLPLSLVSY